MSSKGSIGLIHTFVSTESKPTLKVYFPDRSLRDRFKAACALNASSMNEVIIEFIKGYVEDSETSKNASQRERRTFTEANDDENQ